MLKLRLQLHFVCAISLPVVVAVAVVVGAWVCGVEQRLVLAPHVAVPNPRLVGRRCSNLRTAGGTHLQTHCHRLLLAPALVMPRVSPHFLPLFLFPPLFERQFLVRFLHVSCFRTTTLVKVDYARHVSDRIRWRCDWCGFLESTEGAGRTLLARV